MKEQDQRAGSNAGPDSALRYKTGVTSQTLV